MLALDYRQTNRHSHQSAIHRGHLCECSTLSRNIALAHSFASQMNGIVMSVPYLQAEMLYHYAIILLIICRVFRRVGLSLTV